MKPWVIESFLMFDSMNRMLECDHSSHWKAVEQYFTGGVIFDLAFSGVKGLIHCDNLKPSNSHLPRYT